MAEETTKDEKLRGLPRPTEKMVTELAASLKKQWQEFHDLTAKRRRLRMRKEKVDVGPSGIPAAFKGATTEVRTPDLQYNAQQAQALQLSNSPQPVIRVSKAGLEAKASLGERWLRGGLARGNEATAACAGVSGSQTCYGYGCYCSYARPNAWPDYPTQADGEDDKDYDNRTEEWKKDKALAFNERFVFRSVPVETLMFTPDMSAVVEVKKVNEWDLMKEFGLYRTGQDTYEASQSGEAEDSYVPGREAEVIEYWNPQWRVLYVKNPRGKDGRMLDVWEHRFGRVPYFIAPAYTMGDLEPTEKYIPLLWPMYAEAEENNRLHTMRTAVAHFTAFPYYYIRMKETGQLVIDEKSNEPKVFEFTRDGVMQVPPGGEIVPVNLVSGFDLQAALKDSDDRMKSFALPPIATGNAPSGESAGWNTALLRRFLISNLNPLVQGRAKALAEMFRFWLWSIKHVCVEKVYVYEEAAQEAGQKGRRGEPIGLSAEDIADFELDVVINPDPELDAVSLEAHGWATTQGGGCSMESYLKDYRRLPAPEEEMMAIDADNAFRVLWPAELEKMRVWLTTTTMTERILGGEGGEAVVSDIQRTGAGLGKGAGGQPRVPGNRMPVTMPIGESPTYTPPYAQEGMEGTPI